MSAVIVRRRFLPEALALGHQKHQQRCWEKMKRSPSWRVFGFLGAAGSEVFWRPLITFGFPRMAFTESIAGGSTFQSQRAKKTAEARHTSRLRF
mmetsp:Transcript_31209/g.50298  ORF Transcript_31209/g.50298 Transcript_31209/m.50298 type:complete len:94 (+) Transcript_31209:87-368(+)